MTYTNPAKTIITFGTYDLFHYGHLRLLQRANKLGNRLIVGVSTDELNLKKKGEFPTYSLSHRIAIVEAIKYVDAVFVEESLDKKRDYILRFSADILVMGDDWADRFDYLNDVCEVRYLTRTSGISTSDTIQGIRKI